MIRRADVRALDSDVHVRVGDLESDDNHILTGHMRFGHAAVE